MAFCYQCGTQLPDGARFCASCGAAVQGQGAAPADPPADQSAAPHHAAAPTHPVTPPARGGTSWILPALVLIALLAIGYLLLVPRRGDQPAETPREAVAGGDATADVAKAGGTASGVVAPAGDAGGASGTVSAAVLDSAFNSDPGGAAARYAGPVRVSGVIASMVQPGTTPSLSMEGRTRFNFMVVNFPAGYRERLAPLAKGQFITVSCDGARSLGGTTILSGCLLN